MGDFEELRVGLTNARKEAAKARQKLTSIRQSRARLQTQLAAARRMEPERASSSLSAQLAAASKEERQQRVRVKNAERLARQRANDFAKVADPRSAIARRSAITPILLFPVRLETRFMSTWARDELW